MTDRCRKRIRRCGFCPPESSAALLRRTPTPLFVYDEKSLVRAARALFAFFVEAGLSSAFPVRMNRDPAVLRLLRGAGYGACAGMGRASSRCSLRLLRQGLRYLRGLAGRSSGAAGAGAWCVFVLDGSTSCRPSAGAGDPPAAAGWPIAYDGRAVTGLRELIAGMDRPSLSGRRPPAACGTKELGLGMPIADLCMDARLYPAFAQTLAAAPPNFCTRSALQPLLSTLAAASASATGQAIRLRIWRTARRPSAQDLGHIAGALRGVQLRMSPGRYLAAASGVLITRAVAVKPMAPPLVLLDVQPAQCLRLAKAARITPPMFRTDRRTPSAAADHAGAGRALRQTGPAAAARGRPGHHPDARRGRPQLLLLPRSAARRTCCARTARSNRSNDHCPLWGIHQI